MAAQTLESSLDTRLGPVSSRLELIPAAISRSLLSVAKLAGKLARQLCGPVSCASCVPSRSSSSSSIHQLGRQLEPPTYCVSECAWGPNYSRAPLLAGAIQAENSNSNRTRTRTLARDEISERSRVAQRPRWFSSN